MIYRYLIDPLLSGLRKSIKEQITEGSTCLDIGCGTGDMAFRLMDRCTKVIGIDMNKAAIESAQKRVDVKGLDHLSFKVQDATNMAEYRDIEFDYSIISMAIHQFDPELRKGIISEAKRVSKTVIIADYSCPMPRTVAGKVAEFIEFLAGKQHNRNFKHFQATGGLKAQLDSMGLQMLEKRKNGLGVFTVITV